MTEVRKLMLPYGMAKNADGTWTIFNRYYKPVGVISKDWEAWDIPRHSMKFKSLREATLAKLDHSGNGSGDRVYFYDDGCIPTKSAAAMKSYLEKLQVLMALQVA